MIEVGLIGFGLAGRFFHAQVIRAVPGLRLAAILQRTGDQAAKEYPDVRIVRSLDELLAIESIRLTVIASPNQTHFPFAKRCLEAGRDVVVDKPFTTTVAEAVELYRIAKQYRRVLTVYHSRRFDADFQGLRAFLKRGELGRVVRFETHYDRFRPSGKPGAWREQPGPGSGILFDLAPHLIDQALMLFGRPEAIYADVRMERDAAITDDAFDLCLEYPANMRAKLCATMLSLTPRPRFVVLGTKGSFVKMGFDSLENSLRAGKVPANDSWMLEEEENWGEATIVENGQTVKKRVPSSGDWRDFYVNVRDALLGKAELLVTPQQVLDVMVALELAQQSSWQKRVLPWRDVEWQE
jgi:scyllo-inositol 2-dehydrogenase (NADP+)